MDENKEEKKQGKKISKKLLWGLLALIIAAAVFFAGFFTYYLTMDKGLRSLLWFKKMIDSDYYKEIDDDDFWEAAISGAEKLLDKYSCFYTADEYDAVLDQDKGIMAGTGLSFFSETNMIYKVAINSPAFYTGQAESGMFLTGIGASEQDIRNTFTAEQMRKEMGRYKEGDTVYLRLSEKAADDAETDTCTVVSVAMKTYVESYVLYAAEGKAYANIHSGDTAKWEDVSAFVNVDEIIQASDVGYIKLIQFTGDAAQDFEEAVKQYKKDGKTTLLFDLRNDGGGRVDIMQEIASFLMKDADRSDEIVMKAVYRDDKTETYRAKGDYYDTYFAGSDIYVASNKNTASASEALIGAMYSYGTIGYENIFITDTNSKSDDPVTTYGKGIMQTTYFHFLTGEAVKLTTAKIYWPNGNCIHDRGISTEDGAIASPATTFADYGDPELTWILSSIGA